MKKIKKKSKNNQKSFGQKIGEYIKRKRIEAEMNQSELSFASTVSLDSIRSLETGRIMSPGLETSYKLFSALGLKIDECLSEIARK